MPNQNFICLLSSNDWKKILDFCKRFDLKRSDLVRTAVRHTTFKIRKLSDDHMQGEFINFVYREASEKHKKIHHIKTAFTKTEVKNIYLSSEYLGNPSISKFLRFCVVDYVDTINSIDGYTI